MNVREAAFIRKHTPLTSDTSLSLIAIDGPRRHTPHRIGDGINTGKRAGLALVLEENYERPVRKTKTRAIDTTKPTHDATIATAVSNHRRLNPIDKPHHLIAS